MTLKLAAPWTTFYRQLEAMFKKDDEIEVVFDEINESINILCKSISKAGALQEILPTEKRFGNVVLTIRVVLKNNTVVSGKSVVTTVADAFYGNEAVSEIVSDKDIFGNEFNYVVFEPEVVQFYDDNLTDLNGLCSTLFADIAKAVFTNNNEVFYCTAKV